MKDYTALEEMRVRNLKRYGINGPAVPEPVSDLSGKLEEYALSFIRVSCKELRFAQDEAHRELQDLDGKSADRSQIPLNMERDLDRLCLEQAIHRFMQTGTASDAFDVYFCYLEMFVGDYRGSRKMIELLAEFESNGSSLLMKHRDHYSHSVYVFVLGLAVYQKADAFRKAYQNYYGFAAGDTGSERAAAHHFLRYWGMTALFHDIGYPFELPFEQVKAYFGGSIKGFPFVAYRGVSQYGLPEDALKPFLTPEQAELLAGETLTPVLVLAANLADKLYPAYADFTGYHGYLSRTSKRDDKKSYVAYLAEGVLLEKPGRPELFGGYMDHAFFSAVVLMHRLAEVRLSAPVYADVLTAILLHNSMYKFSVTNVKEDKSRFDFNKTHHFRQERHPLAYLLMLCDELQCWDRVAYGQNSRRQFHPFGCDVEITGNRIWAVYDYDLSFAEQRSETGTYKKMEDLDGSGSEFLRDIEDIISINEPNSGLSLEICRRLSPLRTKSNLYLSSSSFMHLYNFAIALNAQYETRDYTTGAYRDISEEDMENSFDKLSLEYKLSNIAQAEAFAKYLDELGCFYTDRQVAYPLKREFSIEELNRLGRMEHDRWNKEKISMGWQYGTAFQERPNGSDVHKKLIREQARTHNDLNVPYHELSGEEQMKDTAPMNDMMRLIEKFDGLRIYSLSQN